jgi:hypothetical protein
MSGFKSIGGDIFREIIDYVYIQSKKKRNQRKIEYIIETLNNIIFHQIQPYLYTIVGILIIIFCMNVFQFYYYIKLFLSSQQNNLLEIQSNI